MFLFLKTTKIDPAQRFIAKWSSAKQKIDQSAITFLLCIKCVCCHQASVL